MIREAATDLFELRRRQRNGVRVRGDAVPKILYVEDALGLGHLVEGGFHESSVVAVGDDRQQAHLIGRWAKPAVTMPDETRLDALTAAVIAQDGAAFSEAFTLAHRSGYTLDLAPVLAAALFGEWHHRHEEVAQALQQLREPASVDALFRAATQILAYKYDDGAAFARKCTWALADIGTDDARERLRHLATLPKPLGGYAQRRLAYWNEELNRKGARR